MSTQQSKKKPEVYSTSGFRDTLASPVFYPVIVVALVLGVTSIFGFVQNPVKLKNIVNVIQQKVATSNVVSDSFDSQQRYVVSDDLSHKTDTKSERTTTTFDLFSDLTINSAEKMPIDESFERIAFNYDVTSESFWTDLDSSKLETVTEEMERKERNASTIGAPLQLDSIENYPADYNLKDDSIYALNK